MQVTPEVIAAAAGRSPWDPVTIALIGGQIVLIITTIGGVIVSIITHMRVTAVKEQQQVNTAAIGTVAKDTEAIKGHVNSEKTAADGRELALAQENRLLREMINDKTAAAALLAQALATRSSLGRIADQPAMAASVAKVLDSIDQNTADTAIATDAIAKK